MGASLPAQEQGALILTGKQVDEWEERDPRKGSCRFYLHIYDPRAAGGCSVFLNKTKAKPGVDVQCVLAGFGLK